MIFLSCKFRTLAGGYMCRNVGIRLPTDTVSYPRRTNYSATALQKLQILRFIWPPTMHAFVVWQEKCLIQHGRKYCHQNSKTQRQETPETGSLHFCLNTGTKLCKWEVWLRSLLALQRPIKSLLATTQIRSVEVTWQMKLRGSNLSHSPRSPSLY